MKKMQISSGEIMMQPDVSERVHLTFIKKVNKMKMTMNALHAITLLVACFNAFFNAVASSVISEPPPQDLCDIDITIPDWKNYEVVRLFG